MWGLLRSPNHIYNISLQNIHYYNSLVFISLVHILILKINSPGGGIGICVN